MLVVLLGVSLCQSIRENTLVAIRLVDFISFGPDAQDAVLPSGNNVSETVTLQQPIPFFGEIRDRIIVSCEFL